MTNQCVNRAFKPLLLVSIVGGVIIYLGLTVYLQSKEKANFSTNTEINQYIPLLGAFVGVMVGVFLIGEVSTYIGVIVMTGGVLFHAFFRKRSTKSKVTLMGTNMSAGIGSPDPAIPTFKQFTNSFNLLAVCYSSSLSFLQL